MKIPAAFLCLLFGIPAPAQQAQPCSTPEYRQFDFWIGEWNVANPKGEVVGRSRIERIESGCVILENYEGKSGYSGKSFNVYNSEKNLWQQFWVDNQGGVLEFSGTLVGNELRYVGESGKADSRVSHKLTFYNLGRERVRQVWEQSQDNGKTWTTVFDGLYSRTSP